MAVHLQHRKGIRNAGGLVSRRAPRSGEGDASRRALPERPVRDDGRLASGPGLLQLRTGQNAPRSAPGRYGRLLDCPPVPSARNAPVRSPVYRRRKDCPRSRRLRLYRYRLRTAGQLRSRSRYRRLRLPDAGRRRGHYRWNAARPEPGTAARQDSAGRGELRAARSERVFADAGGGSGYPGSAGRGGNLLGAPQGKERRNGYPHRRTVRRRRFRTAGSKRHEQPQQTAARQGAEGAGRRRSSGKER